MTATIDYNKIREMLGVVVSDGYSEYVVADYSIGNDMFKLWDKNRQGFYFTSHGAFYALYKVISG